MKCFISGFERGWFFVREAVLRVVETQTCESRVNRASTLV